MCPLADFLGIKRERGVGHLRLQEEVPAVALIPGTALDPSICNIFSDLDKSSQETTEEPRCEIYYRILFEYFFSLDPGSPVDFAEQRAAHRN